MKKILCLLTATSLLCLSACGGKNESSSEKAESTLVPESTSALTETSVTDGTDATDEADASAETTETPTDAEPDTQAGFVSEFPALELSQNWEYDENFRTYVSNTVVATGNNKSLDEVNNVTYRAWVPVEEYGNFDYCFYFSNTVDSTWAKGQHEGYVGMPGGEYHISSAFIADGGSGIEDEPQNMTSVTFGGSTTKDVASGETFWSDPVNFTVEEGHYLLWEWTITGTDIPCICMDGLSPAYADSGHGQGFVYVNEIPLPVLFGCNREVQNTVITLGDSVTQGSQTSPNSYQFWASEVSNLLGSDVSLWNLGLGYARATDAAQGGNWLQRARYADTVIVAFGTNDIISGVYGEGQSTSAVRIRDAIESIVTILTDAGCEVILLNSPPFRLTEEWEAIRTELNTYIPEIAEAHDNVSYFDLSSVLADPTNPSASLYDDHPNDEGCQLIAEAIVAEYGDLLTGSAE